MQPLVSYLVKRIISLAPYGPLALRTLTLQGIYECRLTVQPTFVTRDILINMYTITLGFCEYILAKRPKTRAANIMQLEKGAIILSLDL